MKKKLSVIIPIYNGERYLSKCIDSVLNQKNIQIGIVELLLINDGSKDGSLNVIQRYKTRHPNTISIVDQKNIGAASSRNKGIRLAEGEFFCLLDQDDFIDENYLSILLESIENSEFNVVQSGFHLTDRDGAQVKTIMPVKKNFGTFLAIPAWAKIYKTQFIKDRKIVFYDNNIGEDSVFTTAVILMTSDGTYGTIPYAGYNNSFDNDNNVTNSLHKGLSESVNIIALLSELKRIEPNGRVSKKLLDYNIIRTVVYYLLAYGRNATSQRFTQVYDELFEWLSSNMPKFLNNKFVIIKPKGEHFSASAGIKVLLLLHRLHLVPLFAKFYCKGETK